MVGAGLLARNAVARGLLASGRTAGYLAGPRLGRPSPAIPAAAGLMDLLAGLGFALAGYGWLHEVRIGNSGLLDEPIAQAIEATLTWPSWRSSRATSATSRGLRRSIPRQGQLPLRVANYWPWRSLGPVGSTST